MKKEELNAVKVKLVPVRKISWDDLINMDGPFIGQAPKTKGPKVPPKVPLVRELPVDCLALSNQLYNLFCRYGMKNCGDVISVPMKEWRVKPGFGPKALSQVEFLLGQLEKYQDAPINALPLDAPLCDWLIGFATPLSLVKRVDFRLDYRIQAMGLLNVDQIRHYRPQDWESVAGLDQWNKKKYMDDVRSYDTMVRYSIERALCRAYGEKKPTPWMERLIDFSDLTHTMYTYLLDALKQAGYPRTWKTLQHFLYEDKEIQQHIRQTMLDRLEEEEFDSLPVETLFELFPEELRDRAALSHFLQDMETQHQVGKRDQRYYRIYPSAYDLVRNDPDPKRQELLLKRIHGGAATDVSKEMGVCLETANRYPVRFMKRLPLVEEMRYLGERILSEGMTPEDFAYVFDLSKDTMDFMAFYLDEPIKYLNRNKRLAGLHELQKETTLPEDIQQRINQRIQFIVEQPHSPKDETNERRLGLLRQVMETYGKEGIPHADILKRYAEMLKPMDPEMQKLLQIDDNYIANGSRFLFLLASLGKICRYYDVPSKDYGPLLKALKLKKYTSQQVSAADLFQAHPKLMAEYDIRNGYELHSLLRKLRVLEIRNGKRFLPKNLTFGRSPTLKFGK